jgi:4-amino-4-deoxy-L-arabinose transferase-like glycosyltransferase
MTSNDAGTPWKTDLLILTLFFGALIFFGLGRLPLANPDEARYAEIAREMVMRSDWVTPWLNDTRYFEKPPLVYWLVAASRALFGPGEFAARLTPALFGLGGILLTYAGGRRLFGREAGLAAGVVLGTSVLYFILSRILLLDMAVSVLMSATLLCFILGLRESPGPGRRWFFTGVYVSAALATLSKGLIGFLIPGAVMFVWLLGLKQWHRLRPFYLPSGAMLFLVIAAPWHVLIAMRNPEWAQFYLIGEHFGRFSTSAHLRTEPIWYFLPILALGFFPWAGFVPGAVRSLAGGWRQREEFADAWFMITWAGFVFLFFSVSESKLIPYILPMFPPLAILTGTWLARCWAGRNPERLRLGFRVFAFTCGLLSVGFFAAVLKPGIIRDTGQAIALRPFGIALGVTMLLGGVAAPWAAKMRGVTAGVGTIVATMTGFILIVLVASPDLQRAGTKELALVARDRVAPEERIYHYWAFFHDFVYYSERPVGLVGYIDELETQFLQPQEHAARFIDDAELRRQWSGAKRVWLVVRKRDQKLAGSLFTDPSFRYHLIAESRAHSLLSNQL